MSNGWARCQRPCGRRWRREISISLMRRVPSPGSRTSLCNKTLYLGNLHPFVTEATLQDVFAGLGGITELKVRGRGAAARCGSSAEPRGCAAAGYLRRAAAGAPRRVVATLQSRSFFFRALAAAP